MKNILIFGASGHGSVVLDCLERNKEYRVVGFVDSYIEKGTKKFGYEVLGTEKELPHIFEKSKIYGGVIAIGDNWTRRQMAERISRVVPNFMFVSVIHPSATIGRGVKIGQGSVVMPGAIVNANARIADHCILNTRASLGHDRVMENYSSLAPGVCTGGNIHLGRGSAISLGSKVIENVRIGSESIIGAGSLVLRNIPELVLAFGNPAEIIRSRMEGEPYLGKNKFSQPTLFSLDNTGS
jgi:sugar O-acyltransferase (sialic acid O-acetyltransferase NeuD family)